MSKWIVKKGLRGVKNAVLNYSEVEKKVREATSNEPWGASHDLLMEIANATDSESDCRAIMDMIWKRVTDQGKNWRHTYKALVLLDFLARAGSEASLEDSMQRMSAIDALTKFSYVDDDGHDHGMNIRNKAKELASTLRDKETLRKERMEFHQAQEMNSMDNPSDHVDDYRTEREPALGKSRGTSRHTVSKSESYLPSSVRSIEEQLKTGSEPQFSEKFDFNAGKSSTLGRGPNGPALSAPILTSGQPFSFPKPIAGRSSDPTIKSPPNDDFDPRAYAKTNISPTSAPIGATTVLPDRQNPNSLYAKEMELAQSMSDRSYENLLIKQSEANDLNDAFALESWRTRIKSYGWKDVNKIFGSGDCAVLLCLIIRLIILKALTHEEIEPRFGCKEVNVEEERKSLLKWLEIEGFKYDRVRKAIVDEAKSMFPSEQSEFAAFQKYIAKMSQSHQYLSITEIVAGPYRDRYVLVFLRERNDKRGMDIEGMIVPPSDYRRVFYCLFSDSGHFDLLQPLNPYDPSSSNLFHQAPPFLQTDLHNIFQSQTEVSSPTPTPQFYFSNSPSPISSNSIPKTFLQQGSNLVSLDDLNGKKSDNRSPFQLTPLSLDNLSRQNQSVLQVDTPLEPSLIPTPPIPTSPRISEDKIQSVKSINQANAFVPKFTVHSPEFIQQKRTSSPLQPYPTYQAAFSPAGASKQPPGWTSFPSPTTPSPTSPIHPNSPSYPPSSFQSQPGFQSQPNRPTFQVGYPPNPTQSKQPRPRGNNPFGDF